MAIIEMLIARSKATFATFVILAAFVAVVAEAEFTAEAMQYTEFVMVVVATAAIVTAISDL